jgi:BirA family biotin operon repressor/biotin-[acetyl-CoA-carboxylase] ligase
VWTAPPGRALLCSLIVREPSRLLSLAAGVAVAQTVGAAALLKWPNDVLLDGRKVAGILVEGRPRESWAVVGIGINVAVADDDFPGELRGRAGGLGRAPEEIEPILRELLGALERWLEAAPAEVLAAWRERDALIGRTVRWSGAVGRASGIDGEGRLLVETETETVALAAGEVHLEG